MTSDVVCWYITQYYLVLLVNNDLTSCFQYTMYIYRSQEQPRTAFFEFLRLYFPTHTSTALGKALE